MNEKRPTTPHDPAPAPGPDEARRANKIRKAIEDEARRAGFQYPSLAPKLIVADAVMLDVIGDVLGHTVAVAELAKKYPNLLGELKEPVRAGTPPPRKDRPVSGRQPAADSPEARQRAMMAELRRKVNYPG